MEKKNFGKRYPDELRARAVRMVLDHESEYQSRSAAISSISQKVGCSRDSLRIWIKQHETDSGLRGGMTTAERDRIKELERENRQLRQANEILKKGETIFRHWSEDNGRTLILRRRSSTAHSANDFLYQGPSRRAWGRADLPGSANRPVYIL